VGILRLLLALSVIASHVGPILGFNFLGGPLAVQSFFIISGFYMSMVLNEKYIGENSGYRLFIGNRLARLLPSYYMVLILSILTSLVIGYLSNYQNLPVLEVYYAFIPNIPSFIYLILIHLLLIGQDVVMFLGIDSSSGSLFFTSNFWNTSPPLHSFLFVPQAWSLGIELTFYLIAPFLLKAGVKRVFIIIILSFCLRLYLYYQQGLQNDPWTYRFFPTEIIFFLLGYMSYQLYKIVRLRQIPVLLPWLILGVLSFFIIEGATIFQGSSAVIFQFSWFDITYLIFVVLSIPVLFNYFKNKRLDNAIAELSYPVYLIHLLVARICGYLNISILHNGWAITLLSIITSYFILLITKPIERFRFKR
jgi:peptidoglycan/LPS O-acetylase OafA/YrhL